MITGYKDKLARKLAESRLGERHTEKIIKEDIHNYVEKKKNEALAALPRVAAEDKEAAITDMMAHMTIPADNIADLYVKYGKLDERIRIELYNQAERCGLTPVQLMEEALKRKKSGPPEPEPALLADQVSCVRR